MIICYTDGYSGKREQSHELLELAIAYMLSQGGGAALADAKLRAASLVRSMKRGEQGKPYIEGFMPFSISHSEGVWAVLFAESECGLDIQFARKCDVPAISRRVYAASDADAVAALMSRSAGEAEPSAAGDGEAAGELFFRIWARREALAKAMGGTAFDSSLPSVLEDSITAGGRSYTVCDIELPGLPGLFAAVCIEGDAGDPQDCASFRKLPEAVF